MSRPRVLFLCSRLPYPVIGGDRLRVTNCARILRKEFEVDLVAVSASRPDRGTLDALHGMFDRVTVFHLPRVRSLLNVLIGTVRGKPAEVAAFDLTQVRRWLRLHAGEYSLGWCHLVRMSGYAPEMPGPRVIDLADAISKHYSEAASTSSPLWRLFYRSQKGRVLKYEGRAIAAFDRALVHTSEDRTWLASAFPDLAARIVISEMGVPEAYFNTAAAPSAAPTCGGPRIAFLGKLNYRPNADAALYLGEEVFPAIRRQAPQAQLSVIGAFPTRRVRDLARVSGITVTGYVDDPVPHLTSADVFVAPMRFGGGLQNKVIQAMALGLPVVGTPLAFRGIGGQDGVHYLCADGAGDLASAVLSLAANPERARALGREARALMVERFTWDRIGGRLLGEVGSLLGASASMSRP
jgi:glycosyltransferase involved in cell wall biosynthesis